MSKKINVKIRYNTNFPSKSDKKWRVLVDETQHLTDEIEVHCKLYSTVDKVIGDDGQEVTKYHVSCSAKSVSFLNKKGVITAIIK